MIEVGETSMSTFDVVEIEDSRRWKWSERDYCNPREGDVACLFVFSDGQRVRVSVAAEVPHSRRFFQLVTADSYRQHLFKREIWVYPPDWQGPMEQDQLTLGGYNSSDGARYFATFLEVVS